MAGLYKYHLDDRGIVRKCVAKKKPCPRLHGATPEEAQKVYEDSMKHQVLAPKLSREQVKETEEASEGGDLVPLGEAVKAFSEESYYGVKPPREVQLAALNGVAQALDEDGVTQLVAACGTGKTYMHGQLLRHTMEQAGAHGVGVVLTSSIKLAHDTAEGLRPPGNDQALGTYGEDYVVIEVHSDRRLLPKGGESILEANRISSKKIHAQWRQALDEGKRVVVVSTYDSVDAVTQAQALFAPEEAEKVTADILIHDEAHNILGQQTPTQIAGEENKLTAYVGFDNRIPGALQADRRLYSTATPIVKELPEDKASTGDVSKAIEIAKAMAKDQKQRVTFYSDDETIVGRMGGFISQEEAVRTGCLAKPLYELRSATLRGDASKFREPLVDAQGILREGASLSPEEKGKYLTPATYGALNATLEAMAADSDIPGVNPTHNVLAYVGSIPQTQSFRNNFKQAALAQAGGMSLEAAQDLQNSDDPRLKRQARMRLLAEHVEAKAAHSGESREVKEEREAAFAMFKGKDARDDAWTPHKQVLANVDIFSEGVSITELDTVVISDDEKLSERAMTQAIGRAIRTVPGNKFKKYGHVIIPEVKDAKGSLNASSVDMAAYGATRVERAITATKLRGGKLLADDATTFRTYEGSRPTGEVLARKRAQDAVADPVTLATATSVFNARVSLMAQDRKEGVPFASLEAAAQHELIKSKLKETIEQIENSPTSTRKAQLPARKRVLAQLEQATPQEVREWGRSGRVVASALAVGDTSSLSPQVVEKLLKMGALQSVQAGSAPLVPVDAKRKVLLANTSAVAASLVTKPKEGATEHAAARMRLEASVLNNKLLVPDTVRWARGAQGTPTTEALVSNFQTLVASDDTFVEYAYAAVAKTDEKTRPHAMTYAVGAKDLLSSITNLEEERQRATAVAASRGEVTYQVNHTMVRKNGELKAEVIRKLLE